MGKHKPKNDSNGKHQLPPVVQQTSSTLTAKFTNLGGTSKHPRKRDRSSSYSDCRSRSPVARHCSSRSPSAKATHQVHAAASDPDSDAAHNAQANQAFTSATASSFLLTNFDQRFQTPKLLLTQLLKYVPRTSISRITPTRNGMIIQTPDPNFATTLRNKHSYEIFGSNASLSRLEPKRLTQPQPPRRQPMLSVVIRGVDPEITDTEAEQELQLEGHTITKCIRIKTKLGTPSYMIRVLTTHQATIDDLLHTGAYIYKRRHRVEPSHTSPPLPVRCERCQVYNNHQTIHCRNDPKCGYCSGPHNTKECSNLQQPPNCATCGDRHPTFSYKCKGRPTPEPDQPNLIVPLKVPEQPSQQPITSVHQSITIDQALTLLTLTLQNLLPFDRPNIIREITYAAKELFQISFQATYSGPYVHFSAHPPPCPT